jgi:hypothetical protein
MPHDDDNDSAESAEDSFGSGGGFFDEPFDAGGSTDSAEDAQDSFAGGGDDDDDDDRNQNFAGGGSGGSGTQTPGESAEDTDATGSSEPPSIDPDLGDTVTGTEAREVLERVEREGAQIENLEERDALASQIERLTGVDARTVTRQFADEDVNVSLGPDGFAVDGTGDDPTGVGTQPPAPETPANEIDAPGSAEEAQDLAASGRLRNFTTASFGALDAPGSAEAAQDFAAGTAFGGTTRASLGALDRPGSAEDAADLRSNDSVPSQAAFDEARTDPDALRDPTLAQGAQRQGRATVTEGFDVLFGSADEAVDRAADAADEGDLLGIADNLLGSTDEAFARGNEADDPVESIDEVLGPTDEVAGQVARSIATFAEDAPGVASDFSQSQSEIEQDQLDLATSGEFQAAFRLPISRAEEQITSAEADEGVLEEVTSGGLLDDEEERILRGAQSRVVEAAGEEFDAVNPTADETLREQQRSSVGAVAAFTSPFGLASGAESGLEVATGSAEVIGDDEGGALFETGQDVGSQAIPAGRRQIEANPEGAITTVATGLLLGAGVGRAAGGLARGGAGRFRTAGGTRISADELTERDVLDRDQPFPPFRDVERARVDQAGALREQAQQNTPEEIQERLGGPIDVDEGEGLADLTKALDADPGRRGGDFEAPASDSELAQEFETVGTSFGPELSPNFLRTGGRSSVSFTPGLPDLGGRPTTAIVRTQVRETDAADVDELEQELLDAEARGDSAARTMSPDEFSPQEAEVLVPPSARFQRVTDSGAARRVGFGSDFFTEVDGQRVPVRLFRDDDADSDADLADAEVGDDLLDLDDIRSRVQRPRDVDDGLTPLSSSAGSSARARRSQGGAAASSSFFGAGSSEGFGSVSSSGAGPSSATSAPGSSRGPPSRRGVFTSSPFSSTSGTPSSSTPSTPGTPSSSTPSTPGTPSSSTPSTPGSGTPGVPGTPTTPGPPDTDPDEDELELLDRLDEAFAGVRAVDTTLAPTEVDFDE